MDLDGASIVNSSNVEYKLFFVNVETIEYYGSEQLSVGLGVKPFTCSISSVESGKRDRVRPAVSVVMFSSMKLCLSCCAYV